MSKVTFNNKKNIFFTAINTKVEQYFKENKLRKTGNYKLYIKSFVLIPVVCGIYVALLTLKMPAALAILLCSLLGFSMASIGFNVMHDANHGSYSRRKWVNQLMGLTANCLGVNAFMWKQKHNIIHHTYTNIDGIDDDIAKMPLLRHCPSQKYRPIHRYQYIYCIPLYSLTTILWTFVTDFMKYFNQKIYTTPIRKMVLKEHIIFWISKTLYIFFYVVLPLYVVGIIPFLIGFTVMQLTKGLTIAMVFQLAHVVEDTHFVDANDKKLSIDEEWAIFQVKTTADFATDNKVLSWFVGGLNFQVEHHLFPKVSHIHYPAIKKIVKETCDKFGIRHIDYATMTDAFASHMRFMKSLSKPDMVIA